MRKAVILVSILCIALLITWSLDLGPFQSTQPSDDPSGNNPMAVSVDAVTSKGTTIAGDMDQSPRALVTSRSGEAPTAAEDTTPFVLCVLRYGTKTPMAMAEVWNLDLRQVEIRDDYDESVRRNNRQKSGLEAYLHSFGASTKTDKQGRCHVPRGEYVHVMARLDEPYGETTLDESTATDSELLMCPDRTLRARVVDAEQVPAEGVDIDYIYTREDSATAQKLLGRTDRAGQFQRPHLQVFAQKGPLIAVSIAASPIGDMGAAVPIDLITPPESIVELTLPPAGSISVRRSRVQDIEAGVNWNENPQQGRLFS